MIAIHESSKIKGVYLAELKAFSDERGSFVETFRKEWFPQRDWAIVQTNRADSQPDVLRGLHYHHQQCDYWYLVKGRIRAGLFDLRPSSPTYRAGQLIEMDGDKPLGLFIPIGVAHGYLTLTQAIITYVVDNYYDGADEFGIAWNDPAVGLDWGIERPILSGRDAANPLLQDIPAHHLPQ